MSHFTSVEVEYEQKNEKELIEALEKQFGKGHVEVHPKGGALIGWHGDDRSKLSHKDPNYAPPCELIIRRKYVGGSSNDVGFKRTENGKYIAYISDFDKGTNVNLDKQSSIAMEYGMRVAERQLKAEGWNTTRINEKDGSVTVQTTGRAFVTAGVGGGNWGKKGW